MADEHRRPKLKDVAARAGTSIATASRVLNNTGYIAEDTRAKVMQAAELLNYQPNLRAKGLRHGSSRTIGVLIPNLLNAYYTALADSISLLLTSNDYQMLLSSTRDDPLVEWKTLRTMIGHDVDGLIWVPTVNDPKLVKYLQSQRTPVISIIRRLPGSGFDTIVFKDYQGSQAATQHLIELGHRRIGFIGGDIHQSSNHDRWQGFLNAMQDSGRAADDCLVKLGSTWSEWGEKATGELLELEEPPTAIFVASNAIMPGVLKTLRQHALQLPEDMSLVCFDDLDWFSYSLPPITAVTTDHLRFAEAAVDLLMNRIHTPKVAGEPSALVQINFDLIVRQSTMAPRHYPLLQR